MPSSRSVNKALATAGLVLALAACRQGEAQTYTLRGTVSAVVDGDTLDIGHGAARRRIRIAGIDAPERGQAFGLKARQHLDGLAYRQPVEARCSKTEIRPENGRARAICTVTANGTDLGLAQLRAGYAWHFRRFSHEQQREQRNTYAQAEQQARAQHAGLWTDPRPLAPWDWRDAQRAEAFAPAPYPADHRR